MDDTARSTLRGSARQIDRRTVLATGAGLATTALAGCAQIADFLAGFVLKDVNVINGTERPIAGSIEVTGPGGDVVLDETFDLEATEQNGGTTNGGTTDGNDQPDDAASGLYGGVFDGEGDYAVVVELESGTDFGASGTEETVTVNNPGDEHVFVFFGAESGTDEIVVTVADGLSDLEDVSGS
jgi:hypothetical protein